MRHDILQDTVGRQEEVILLSKLVHRQRPFSLLNIYGPGGIGKTVVCHKFEAWCAQAQIPYATIVGDTPTAATTDKMLYQLRRGLVTNVPRKVLKRPFREFDQKWKEYLAVQKVLEQSGGIAQLFDLAGNLVNHALLKMLLGTVEGAYKGIRAHFVHRGALERYVGGVDTWLTDSFIECLTKATKTQDRFVLFVDAYEMMEDQDHWMSTTWVNALPQTAILVVLGRDRLDQGDSEWAHHARVGRLYSHELKELGEGEAKGYLCRHGLRDDTSLERVYSFTGGYPLCLVLAVELSREVGWDQVRNLEEAADRYRVASQLLERILRQEKVREVQEFLEKGVVVPWFDPSAISYILEVNAPRAEEIYSKIGRFSFVQRHPNGLKFHDKVRELLRERLWFVDDGKTYMHLVERWDKYLATKADV
jgi:hypothetical protein